MTTFGTITPDQLQNMTGLEALTAMVAGDLPTPPIGGLVGVRLVEIEKGRPVSEGPPGPSLLNPLGAVHGGYALTLIDSACGCAVHSELGGGVGHTQVQTQGHLHRP